MLTTKEAANDPRWITAEQEAKDSGLSKATVTRWYQCGKIKGWRLGAKKSLMVEAGSVKRYITDLSQQRRQVDKSLDAAEACVRDYWRLNDEGKEFFAISLIGEIMKGLKKC